MSRRISQEYSDRISKHFNALVYYHVHGLILAGTPLTEISLIESKMPDIETLIHVKGKPKIRVRVRFELEEHKAYLDEFYYNTCQPTHLQAFLDNRKSQPPAI